MRVSFLIGGAEPAGTNHLYHLLQGHRNVCLPLSPQPEPNFFSKAREFQKGPDDYHRRFFSHRQGESLIGEKSGRYLWHPEAGRRIRAYNPRMKLIFILRDPVDRAYSHHRFNCMNGIETLPFGKALAAEPERVAGMSADPFWTDVQPFAYFEKGLYAGQLARYLELFPRGQIHLIENETLRRNPRAEVEKVLSFLELPTAAYRFVENAPEYPSYHVRSLLLQKAIRSINRPFLERAVMKRRSGERPAFLEALALLNLSTKRMRPQSEVAEILRSRYRDDCLKLRGIAGIDVSRWLGGDAGPALSPALACAMEAADV